MRELYLYGISFCTTPPEGRGQFRIEDHEAATLIRQAVRACPGIEAMVVSGLNRTECWVVLPPGLALDPAWVNPLTILKPALAGSLTGSWCYRKQGSAAIGQFLRRGIGLDSPCLGDPAAAAELQRAAMVAGGAGGMGRLLQALLSRSRTLSDQVAPLRVAGETAESLSQAVAAAERSIAAAIGEFDAGTTDVSGDRLLLLYDRLLHRRQRPVSLRLQEITR